MGRVCHAGLSRAGAAVTATKESAGGGLSPAALSDDTLARNAGFSLHAGVASAAHERAKLERLCRYITRPAVSAERLSLTAQGNIRYRLKTPYRDGTTDVMFEPLDFMARLAALVPTPRVNLTRYHGVFAPNHRLREQITPSRRGQRHPDTNDAPAPSRPPLDDLGATLEARIQDRYRNL